MKNVLVDSLALIVHNYYQDLKAGGVECRLVIPGLTIAIAVLLQEKLLDLQLPSYLVIPESREPSEIDRWIRAEAVTTVRQGDMIVVVWPGEMSRIQDSVIGAGGAIRNFAFGDEWPWIDSGNEYFHFDGPVIENILSQWEIADAHRDAYSTILRSSLTACRDSLKRGDVFLDKIIGNFDPKSKSTIVGEVDRFLFHLGIPAKSNVHWYEGSEVQLYFDEIVQVGEAMVKRVKDLGGKQELLSRILEIEPDPISAAELDIALRGMIDRTSLGGDEAQSGLLTFYGAWESESAWSLLSLPMLAQILEVAPLDERVVLTLAVIATPGTVSDGLKSAVLLQDGSLSISGVYAGLNDDTSGSAKVVIYFRPSDPFFEVTCTGSHGKFECEINFDSIFGKARVEKRIIKFVVMRGTKELAISRLPVYRCDPLHPFVALFQPASKVLIARDGVPTADSAEEAEIIEVKEPTSIRVVVWDRNEKISIELDDQVQQLDPVAENPNLFVLEHPIDPALTGSGRTRLGIRGFGNQLVIDIAAKDVTRGEFTLERELLVRLSRFDEQGNRAAVERLLGIFLGTKNAPYPALGGIDETSRTRIALSRVLENDELARPVIVDLFASGHDIEFGSNAHVTYGLAKPPAAFIDCPLSQDVSLLLAAYVAARTRVKSLICSGARTDSQWPYYAFLPTYVAEKSEMLSEAIASYLSAYLGMLNYAQENSQISWVEKFRLTCGDCVVHWDDQSDTSHKYMLIGPWHPIVIAKRYMVQIALVDSAVRHLRAAQDDRTHAFARLLDQVNAIRWFATPAVDNATFDSYYIAACSDPGWLVAIEHRSVGTGDFLARMDAIRRVHGLETSLMPSSSEHVARGYLQDFFNAYPTRRSISVLADASYAPARLVESAEAILYNKDDVSAIGRQLPGGIHIGVASKEVIEECEWRAPPVCLYRTSQSPVGASEFPDIELISPGKATSTRETGSKLSVPRGRSMMASFISPLRELGELSNGVLISRSLERDRIKVEDVTLGGLFTEVCRVLAALPGEAIVMNWQATMPPKLVRLWTVVPGSHVDPAVFVKFVTKAIQRGENAALWDYSMSLTGALNSYFVLSKIPESVSHELNKSPVLNKKMIAPAVLGELGRVGMALGSESLRSGSKALGVIGVVAAVRLFFPQDAGLAPLRNDPSHRGFLLPVDSFREVLGAALDGATATTRQRADLVAIQLRLLPDATLAISCCAIECKYTSGIFNAEQLLGAVNQADSTLRRLLSLVASAKVEGGIPERLALLALISFGLRLSQESCQGFSTAPMEAKILESILDGKILLVPARAGKVVVITECGAAKATWSQTDALVIRLCTGSWPGISESLDLSVIRKRVTQEFEEIVNLGSFENLVADLPDASVDEISKQGQSVSGSTVAVVNPCTGSPETGNKEAIAPLAVVASDTASELSMSFAARTPDITNHKLFDLPLTPVLLGRAKGKSIFFDPQNSTRPLDNNNVMVTGSSGKGKTQLIKAFAARLRHQDKNILMLDFKNDFASDKHFLKEARLDCSYISFDGLPFNPLIPVPIKRPDSDVEYLAISEHINGIVDIFRKTFGLGDQQEAAVKNAIRECFEERGIPSRGTVKFDQALSFPDFNDVGDRLRDSNPAAYNRLDPLFDLGIFPPEFYSTRFDTVLHKSTVMDLSQIQNDRIKSAVAKVLVMSAHRFYNARPHSGILRQFFIFDEAHRILDSEFVLQFVRECRAYGVGVLLSSQYPSDFPADVSASLNTKILHGNGGDKDRVREIMKVVGGALDEDTVAELSMFRAIVTNPQYLPAVVDTISYPMLLVLQSLGQRALPLDQLEVAGIDPSRLDVAHLLSILMKVGLVEQVSGGYRCVCTA